MLHSALNYTHELIEKSVSLGDTVIDATVGNGNDTVKLAELVGKNGLVIGFDIQKQAIKQTKTVLQKHNLIDRTTLYQTGHEHLLDYYSKTNSVAAVIFNLGFLPKGDKSIVTSPSTTLKAIESGLSLLKKNGLLLIMVYHGHEGGKEEKEQVEEFVKELPQKQFSVLKYDFINQKNSPPFLLAIEKRK